MPVVLGCPHFLLGGLVCGQGDRDIVREVAPADDHGTGMDSDLPDAALQLDGVFQDFLDQFGAVLELVLEFWQILHAVFQIGIEFLLFLDLLFRTVLQLHRFLHLCLEFRLVRNHLGQPCRFLDGETADSGHILDGTLGRHCAEGDHMGDMVFAVCLLNILESSVPAFIIEVDVYIRHRDTVRVEETLEQEVILDRVEVGDLETVSHDRTRCRTSTRTYGSPYGSRGSYKVLDDKEVVRETHP